MVPGKPSIHESHTNDDTKVDLEPTQHKSHLPSPGGQSQMATDGEDRRVVISTVLSESSSPPAPKHKAAISLTHFSCAAHYMKRPGDNEPRRFGTGVTMRGKHNCTPAWVSLETHGAVERRSRTHTMRFLPLSSPPAAAATKKTSNST